MEVRSITRSRRFYFHPTAAHRGPPIGERETHAAKTNKMEQEQVEYKVITLLLLLETDKSYVQNPTYAKSGNRRQSCFVSKRYGPAFIGRPIFTIYNKETTFRANFQNCLQKIQAGENATTLSDSIHASGISLGNERHNILNHKNFYSSLPAEFSTARKFAPSCNPIKKEHRTMLSDRQQAFAGFEFPESESVCLLNPVGRSVFARIAQQDGQQGDNAQQNRIIEITDDLQGRQARQPRSHQQLGPVGQQSLRETRKRVEQE